MRCYQWIVVTLLLLGISACSSHEHSRYLGYIEGRYVYISSPVSGILKQLAVQKGQSVMPNQLAFQLDPEPELSQLNNAKTNLVLTQKMFIRNKELRKTGAVGEATLDASQQQYDSAEAQVSQFSWMVSQKTVHFAQSGFVQDTLFRQNEFVPAGKPVIALLPPENRIVIFFVPETVLSQIKYGQKINISCDACAKHLSATIDYISSQAEYTPPVIYSKDSREKLVYWVEAKLDPAIALQMNPGQPIEVEIGNAK